VVAGRLLELELRAGPQDVFGEAELPSGAGPCDPQSEYVYEEEELESEERRAEAVRPLLARTLAEAGLPALEPAVAEVSEGLMALRYGSVGGWARL
jgi:hypothetical protein